MDKRIPESISDASDKRAGDQQSGGIYPDTACQGKDAWNRDTKVEAGNRLQCGSVLPLILAAVYGTYRYEQAQLLRYEYVLTGAGIFALLLLMKQFMGFMNKEDMILDGLLDYMENTLPARKPVPDEQALKEQTREELIDKVTEGIRQTAASETKFSHMLTPEEEHIMREVIREYLI